MFACINSSLSCESFPVRTWVLVDKKYLSGAKGLRKGWIFIWLAWAILLAGCTATGNQSDLDSALTSGPIAISAVPGAEATSTLEPTAQAAREFLREMMFTNEEWPFVPLQDPEFILASEAEYIQPRDLVLGISINGESKAYPTSMMWFHHVANDNVGGIPVAITYCVVCSSGVAFNPLIEGERYNFALFALYDAVMVLADDETGSVWAHLSGIALDGPMKGAQLEILPLVQTTWERWQELHPDTLVLSNETEYTEWYANPGLGEAGFGPEFLQSIVNWDDRLPSNTLVLGVDLAGSYIAYPVQLITTLGSVVNDTFEGHPLLVIVDSRNAFSIAYSRELNGQILTFENVAILAMEIVDRETGSHWSVEGEAISGPLEGQQLSFVTSYLTEWYGWAAFHPGSDIYP